MASVLIFGGTLLVPFLICFLMAIRDFYREPEPNDVRVLRLIAEKAQSDIAAINGLIDDGLTEALDFSHLQSLADDGSIESIRRRLAAADAILKAKLEIKEPPLDIHTAIRLLEESMADD